MAQLHESPATYTYLKLIGRFPLRRIRDNAGLDAASSLVDELLSKPNLEDGERDYLDVLSDLIERYEEATDPFPVPPLPDRIRYLLECRGVTQDQLATDAGIPAGTLAEILGGERPMDSEQVASLASYFHVDPLYLSP